MRYHFKQMVSESRDCMNRPYRSIIVKKIKRDALNQIHVILFTYFITYSLHGKNLHVYRIHATKLTK